MRTSAHHLLLIARCGTLRSHPSLHTSLHTCSHTTREQHNSMLTSETRAINASLTALCDVLQARTEV